MFSGLAGATATAMDESAQAWKQLWLTEEKMRKDEDLEKARQAFEQRRLEQEKALNDAANAGADERARRELEARQNSELFTAFKDLPVSQQLQQASVFKGTVYESWADNITAGSLFASPGDANNFLQTSVASTDAVGTIVNLQWVEEAAKASASQLNLDQKGIDSYVKWWVDLANKNSQGVEQLRDAEFESQLAKARTSQANLESLQANTAASNQQIEESKARVADLARRGANEDELQPYLVQEAEATVKAMQQTFDFNELFNPERIRNLTVTTDGAALSNETAEAIQASIIKEAEANATAAGHNATIAGAQAGIAYALATFTLADAEANVGLKNQQKELIIKQMDQIDADIASGKIRDQIAIDGATEAKISLVTQLAAKGFGDLAQEMSNKYLKDIVGEDRLDDLNAQLNEISTRAEDEAQAVSEANIAVAHATSKYAEDNAEADMRERRAKANIAETDASWRERQNEQAYDMNERGMRVNEGTLAIQQATFERAGKVSTAGMSSKQVFDAISSISGYDLADINKMRADYDVLEGDIQTYSNLANRAVAGDTNALAQLRGILNQPQLTKGDLQSQLPSLLNDWQQQLQTASRPVVRAMSSYINVAAGYDVPISPSLFGLQGTNDILYGEALKTNPAFVQLPEDVSENKKDAVAEIISDINNAATTMSPDELAVGGAAVLLQSLIDEHGEDAVAALHLESPSQLYDYMVPQNQEFTKRVGDTEGTLKDMGYDLYDFDSRQRATQDLAHKLQAGETLVNALGGIGNLPEDQFNTIIQTAKDWLASNGRPLTLSEEVMYGPGDYINTMNSILNNYGGIADNLNWLSPRLAAQGK